MISITLPDGSIRAFAPGTTPMEVAKNISEGFARNVISASFEGTTIETSTPLTTDGSLILYTWNDAEGKSILALNLTRNGAGARRNVSRDSIDSWSCNCQWLLL